MYNSSGALFFSPVLLVESSTTYRFYYNIVIYNIIVYIVFVSYTEKKTLKNAFRPRVKDSIKPSALVFKGGSIGFDFARVGEREDKGRV